MKPITPPTTLSIVEEESLPIVNPSVTETPVAPIELARPTVFKDATYIATKDDDGDWFLAMQENGEFRHLRESEAKRIASIMNEQGSNIITLYCRNEKCKHKGSWIKRASDDVKKNVYFCDGCKQGMTR